jgi:hypothetical protein
MGCKDCENFTREAQACYPYRWKNATIEILACAKHAEEIIQVLNIIQALNDAQREERKAAS